MDIRDNTLFELIRANESKSIKVVENLKNKYDIDSVLAQDIEYIVFLHFLKLYGEKNDDKNMVKKIEFMKDKERIKTLNIIARRQEDEDIYKLIETRDVTSDSDANELFRDMLGEE